MLFNNYLCKYLSYNYVCTLKPLQLDHIPIHIFLLETKLKVVESLPIVDTVLVNAAK